MFLSEGGFAGRPPNPARIYKALRKYGNGCGFEPVNVQFSPLHCIPGANMWVMAAVSPCGACAQVNEKAAAAREEERRGQEMHGTQ